MKISWQFISFLILGILLYFLVNVPLILNLWQSPKDTFYTFVHHEQVDYYLYLSVIKAGMSGLWTTPAVYTGEHTQNSLIYFFLIIVGKLASFFSSSPIFAYHLTRTFAIWAMLVAIYLVCKKILGKEVGFWAALISLLSTFWPFMNNPRWFPTGGTAGWWQIFDPVARLDYLPHHAAGIAFLFMGVYFISQYYQKRKNTDLVLASVTSFAAGFVFPPAGSVIVFVLPVGMLIYQIKVMARTGKLDKGIIPGSFLIFISSFLALFLIRQEVAKGFPWSQWQDWDKNMWNSVPNFNRDFILGGGATLLAALPAVFYFLLFSDAKFEYIFLSLWAILPYVLLSFTDYLGIGKIRLGFMGTFLPLGILATITVRRVASILPIKNRNIFYFLCLILFFTVSLPVSLTVLEEKFSSVKKNFPNPPLNAFVPLDMLDSMNFMNSKIEPYSVVLAEFTVGNMLPAFAPAKTYLGSWTQTKDYWLKIEKMSRFYSGLMTKEEAAEFISSSNIKYIYVGRQERKIVGDIKKYSLPVEEIYNKNGTIIYEVQ